MTAFASWVKRFPGDASGGGAAVLFPHAGGAAASYRTFANCLSGNGVDTYVLQYPRRADRLRDPAAGSLDELARQLFDAGDWTTVAPLQLFGHCMGATVAFEFARTAEANGIAVQRLWVSAGQAPSTLADSPPLPTTDEGVLADVVDLGGTDPSLFEDEDFAELLLMAVHADYRAQQNYSPVPGAWISAPIHALGGTSDHRVSMEQLQRWDIHTGDGFELTFFDGGHFYLTEHLAAVATLMSTT